MMGYRIREIRERRNLTQEQLAKMSGVSRTTIWSLETNCAKSTTSKTLLRIAAALGVTVDQIFFDEGV